jgi:hypothetical protein
MKKKRFERTAERPYMSNSTFILGMNKVTHYSMLTEDIEAKQKSARKKVTEKWIEMYEELLPPERKPLAKNRKDFLKNVITRVYYYLKLYLRTFDLEKLL